MNKKKLKAGILLSVLLLFSLFSIVFYNQLTSLQSMIAYCKEMDKSAKRLAMFDLAKKNQEEADLFFQDGEVKISKQGDKICYQVILNEDQLEVLYYQPVPQK